MTTRLNLAAALVGEPQVLILDEPASSLDSAGRIEVLELIAALAPATTVLLSSHDLAEIEAICENVGILSQGRLVYQGALSELLAGAARSRWTIVVRPPTRPAIEALTKRPPGYRRSASLRRASSNCQLPTPRRSRSISSHCSPGAALAWCRSRRGAPACRRSSCR
jgi:ABC-type multidrug transport system ATPase subunit